MLWNLDPSWLLTAFAVVAMLSYLFGLALDGVMGAEGFGPLGNMVIITAGFFLGIFSANSYGIFLENLTVATGAGLTGAFVSLGVLAVCKATLNRL